MKEIVSLRERIRRLRCRVFGHRPDPAAPPAARLAFCLGCGHAVER